MLHTIFQGHTSVGFREENLFEKVLTIYGHGYQRPFEQTFIPLFHEGSI